MTTRYFIPGDPDHSKGRNFSCGVASYVPADQERQFKLAQPDAMPLDAGKYIAVVTVDDTEALAAKGIRLLICSSLRPV
jgi:hypothetical protein